MVTLVHTAALDICIKITMFNTKFIIFYTKFINFNTNRYPDDRIGISCDDPRALVFMTCSSKQTQIGAKQSENSRKTVKN